MDYQTLLWVQSLMLIVALSGILVAWRLDVTLKGIGEYALGTALLAMSMVVLAVSARAYPNAAVIVSNLIVLSGMVLLRVGLLKLLGQPEPVRWIWIWAVLIAALGVWMSYASLGAEREGRYWRIVILSSVVAAISALIVMDGLRARKSPVRGPRIFVGITFALTALINAIRVVLVVVDPVGQVDNFPSDYERLFRLGMILSSFAITVGAVLMMAARLIERLDEEASIDPLTGVLNRRGFEAVASPMLALDARQQLPVALMVMDLDLFKSINDRYGHAVGDIVLREFAVVAAASLRAQDVLARFGGEEFVVLIENGASEHPREVADRLRRRWAEHEIHHQSAVLRSTVSIGIAAIDPRLPQAIDSAYCRADKALYRAKESGRNCVVVESGDVAAPGPGVAEIEAGPGGRKAPASSEVRSA